ncbi:SNW/SKI-interacting protein A-like isoform X2 [Silene latifolia]|uniref:SNW/SKI-interacting protein A-like isoform X2 n=1 Tax=Silene latifolia TaxID=37657 RepID=UPI003D76E806
MVAPLRELLPPAKSSKSTQYDHTNDPWFKNRFTAEEVEKVSVSSVDIPSYLNRHRVIPRKPEDFGDGGAFPEIHVAQYPLGMGTKDSKPGSEILPVTVDSNGNVAFDAVVRQNENASKIVFSQYRDLVPKILKGEEAEEEELQTKIEETREATQAAVEEIVNVKLSVAQPKNVPKQSTDSKFIKYQPSQQSAAFNSGAKQRIIRLVEMPVDPLEPPKFKHKKVPKAYGSPPVPVMHSPPRPVTVKDQQDWKIPPCISNWKNSKGYTIPLDKRLAADGRGLQEVQINDNFAELSESLYVAEQKAREAVSMRSKVQKEMFKKDKEKKEAELRALAAKARSERTCVTASVAIDDSRADILQREKIREDRGKERKRERRLEAKSESMRKKSKITRDRDRDISEKVALGMASVGDGRGEVMYDQRLFNQEKGMDSGFATDDQYNVYDKSLFTAQATLSTLYQPKKDVDSDVYGAADKQLEKIKNTERFKPNKAFTGTSERAATRGRPLEFEQEEEAPAVETDLFGLDRIQAEMTKGLQAMDGVGGGSSREGYDGSSSRSRIKFERGS